ncbi:glycosyltransferase [Nocardiopsis alba]|uniref:glycosyltransferase n=1 Tax=Nocardiopsis alba TaxID=53437 RepID=UPI003805ACB8
MKPEIDPALGLALHHERTLPDRRGSTADVVIPAHNEQATIVQVVQDAHKALTELDVQGGRVIVSASGCTDNTAELAQGAGAEVVISPAGKGRAMLAGIQASTAEIICLIDGDFEYFGGRPLASELLDPIIRGVCDATIADLHWRPLYPQLWLLGFFTPLAGRIFPEMLPAVGHTPWSGQRAAVRSAWPSTLPDDFTSDLAILLHWLDIDITLRPVVADDWTNPQRPKPDLMRAECDLLIKHAIHRNRISEKEAEELRGWFSKAHSFMAEYDPGTHEPKEFEKALMNKSLAALP